MTGSKLLRWIIRGESSFCGQKALKECMQTGHWNVCGLKYMVSGVFITPQPIFISFIFFPDLNTVYGCVISGASSFRASLLRVKNLAQTKYGLLFILS